MLNDAEVVACRELLELALREDTQDRGDLTCQAIIPANLRGQADLVARAKGVLAGIPVVNLLVEMRQSKGAELYFESAGKDGAKLKRGSVLGTLSGSMREMLLVERTALNFLQRLCGVATLTRKYVEEVEGLSCQILDTRKTTPGWRLLEKYAVRCGGGRNHRLGLFDGVMIKDNHLAALAQVSSEKGTLCEAVRTVREKYKSNVPIEVEVDNFKQLEEVLSCEPDMILLDNMSPEQLREAVRLRDEKAPKVLLEASGGITLKTVRAIGESGVDRISVGAITHSAPALDIGLDYRLQ